MSKILLAIAGVGLTSGALLIVSGWCRGVLGFAVCMTAVLISLRRWRHRCHIRLVLMAGVAIVLCAALMLNSPVDRVLALSWLFAALYIIEGHSCRHEPGWKSSWPSLHWAGLGLAGLLLWYERSDRAWFLIRRVAGLMSLTNTPVGMWVSALPIYTLGFLVLLSAAIAGRSRRTLACMLVLSVGFPVASAILAGMAPIGTPAVSAYHLAAVLFVAGVVSQAGLRHRLGFKSTLISVALTAGVLLSEVPLPCRRPEPARRCAAPCSYALYSRGLLDWNVPDGERLGLVNSGMFGLFRRCLEHDAQRRGGQVVVVDSLARDTLSRIGVVVLINPTVNLTEPEVQGLKHFVTSGGGLLILGDHTDIAGSREPLNTALSFTSMRFNFDSAMPLRQHWQACLEIRKHMLTRRVRNETMLQMGVGATLNITPPAFPLVVGRYGFADTGDKNNAGRGAYMGDGLHGDGERVGDIVLVAGQRLGAGRVVTFGDTSPFQNGAMFLSQHLVSDVIAWLLPGCRVAKTVGGAVDPDFGQEIAIIDFSFKPRLRLELFTETSLGGLANCLVRAGVAPVPALSTGDWTRQAGHIFLINPTEEIGDAEAKWLLEYVATGGNLILSQGYVAPHPCRRLISPLGYSIEPIPLGGGDSERPVRHRNAWPVSYSGQADTSVLATAFGYPTIVTMRVGTGTFTIVGDGELLLDKNLEGELGGNPDNVTFVTGLVENLRSGKRYAVGSEQ